MSGSHRQDTSVPAVTKPCPHPSLTGNQLLGSYPSNHNTGHRECAAQPPFLTVSAEPPEPVASKGLAPQGLCIPNLSSSIGLSEASLIHKWDLSQPLQRVMFPHMETLFEPAELLQPYTFWCMALLPHQEHLYLHKGLG